MELFGTGGIRKKFSDFDILSGKNLCRTFGEKSDQSKAVIAYDGRTSCIPYYYTGIAGLCEARKQVIDLGIAPTPVVAYASMVNDAVGISTTASHNPLEYVGYKFFMNGIEQSELISKETNRGENLELNWEEFKDVEHVGLFERYIEMLEREFLDLKNSVLGYDSGGLCGARYFPAIAERIGIDLISTNSVCCLPERELEPRKENLAYLQKLSLVRDVTTLIAFDGDVDRCRAIVDKRMLEEDEQLLIMTGYVLKKRSGKIVTTVEASTSVSELVKHFTGKDVVRVKVGSANIAKALKENDGLFGGEPCGEYIFPEFHYCADGMITGLMLLRALGEIDYERILDDYCNYILVRKKVDANLLSRERFQKEVIEGKKLMSVIEENEIESIDRQDGIRINFKQGKGFVLLRASGTENVIRITVERSNKEEANLLAQEIEEKIIELCHV